MIWACCSSPMWSNIKAEAKNIADGFAIFLPAIFFPVFLVACKETYIKILKFQRHDTELKLNFTVKVLHWYYPLLIRLQGYIQGEIKIFNIDNLWILKDSFIVQENDNTDQLMPSRLIHAAVCTVMCFFLELKKNKKKKNSSNEA